MSETFDLLIRGGIAATPNGIAEADVGVRGGRIAAIGALGNAKAAETFDAKGLHVLPGVIDTQVHFREPGNEHKEDLETGSRAAVLGGVTGVFEMPNTNPPTTTRAAIEDKLARAKNRMHCDYAFYAGATPANVGALGELERIARRLRREGVSRFVHRNAAAQPSRRHSRGAESAARAAWRCIPKTKTGLKRARISA